ncbi:sugar fermentation stimulation protein SfsA [Clostridia bacterium]|nr:sugar fermentation stimulation protein SfsA [Clostridia bacterium]
MVYDNIREGVFLRRPNRFIAEVEIGGSVEVVHVKNTGRCKELLTPGAKVYLSEAANQKRATKYDLVAVYKEKRLINMDSYAPNRAFGEFLRQGRLLPGATLVKPETKYGGSRFDFYIEAGGRKAYIEVKGVTLEKNGVAMFPDAPTERGVKHLNELAKCVADGYEAFAVFVIQMEGVRYFTPNYKMHPEFGAALAAAMQAGVTALAFDCLVTANSMVINCRVPIKL